MSTYEILLVDDDEIGRYVIAAALRRFGFVVREASGGAQALAAVSEQAPDLVVSDVQMPGINGFEVCRRIKADERTAGIPILLLSATFLESEYQVEGLHSGADAYLTQPVEAPVLDATVRALLRTRQAEQEVRRGVRQWRTTFDAMDDAICILDHDGSILRANRAFAALAGRDVDAVGGLDLLDAIPEAAALAEDPATEQELLRGERVFRSRQHAVVGYDAVDGQRVLILTDITEQRRNQQRDRAISLLLQRSLMPDELTQVPGVAVAARHRSAGERSLVGGDFYDVIRIDERTVWVVIGDVAGHGVETAAKANELRHSLRAYAREGYFVDAALERMNALVLADDLVGLASVCLVSLDLQTAIAEVTIAGHPAPVMLGADGAARLLDDARGPVLGVSGATWKTQRHRIPDGTRLILYTDGLVERPDESLDDSFERLLARSATLSADDDLALGELLNLVAENEALRDDVAVMLVRLAPEPPLSG